MKFNIYDPVVKAYREVELTKEEAEKYIASAKEAEKKLKKKGGKKNESYREDKSMG